MRMTLDEPCLVDDMMKGNMGSVKAATKREGGRRRTRHSLIFLMLGALVSPTGGLQTPSSSLAAVVVTSPARCHPSTELFWTVLDSMDQHFAPLDVLVVCDGCKTPAGLQPEHADRVENRLESNPLQQSKQGLVNTAQGQRYEQYKRKLHDDITARGLNHRVKLLELDSHHGFAFAVKVGLEDLLGRGFRFSLVVQHDRVFVSPLPPGVVRHVLTRFDTDPTMRYCALPTSTSRGHATVLAEEYKLHTLLAERTVTLPSGTATGADVFLRPCIFWWDSNHLVDNRRALELFAPFTNAAPGLLDRLGGSGLRKFLLRRGDFIEDRLGQAQRGFLASLRHEPGELLRYFDWFGSYLVEVAHHLPSTRRAPPHHRRDVQLPRTTLLDKHGREAFVLHINGRGRRNVPAWTRPGPSAEGGSAEWESGGVSAAPAAS